MTIHETPEPFISLVPEDMRVFRNAITVGGKSYDVQIKNLAPSSDSLEIEKIKSACDAIFNHLYKQSSLVGSQPLTPDRVKLVATSDKTEIFESTDGEDHLLCESKSVQAGGLEEFGFIGTESDRMTIHDLISRDILREQQLELVSPTPTTPRYENTRRTESEMLSYLRKDPECKVYLDAPKGRTVIKRLRALFNHPKDLQKNEPETYQFLRASFKHLCEYWKHHASYCQKKEGDKVQTPEAFALYWIGLFDPKFIPADSAFYKMNTTELKEFVMRFEDGS